MSKRRYDQRRGSGYFSDGSGQGYAAYRYGNSRSRDVYIPGKPRQAIFKNKDQLEHVVRLAVEQLSDWRLSPFEHEGDVRAGMRSEMCLQSLRWDDADRAAASIVSEALTKIGAKRPTWEEGQRNYVEPRENCAWCQKELPEDMLRGDFSKRFCSDVCAKSAIASWDFESRSNSDRTMRAARDSIRRLQNPPKPCAHCKKAFRPRGENLGKFCSDECRAASTRKIFERPCAHCGTVFLPTTQDNGRGQFCSTACHHAHRASYRIEMQCRFCGAEFVAASKKADFCSKACAVASSKMRRGWVPKQTTPHVFDHYLTMPINASRPAWLTPERFDEMVAG